MPFLTLDDTKNQSFDYILVGGGTVGLTLAARLTEDPNVKVLVLEAGEEHLDDPLINVPSSGPLQIGNPKYDWLHKTTPQKHAGGRQYPWPRGKGLGGSSAMNFQCVIPPPASDIDSWEKLGNPGWNYENYKKYFDRAFSYRVAPEDKDPSSKALKIREDSGDGPVQISYFRTLPESEIILQQTLLSMGFPKAKAPIAGDPTGLYFAPVTVDPKTFTRSYAVTAYYLPNASRPNFSVLLKAHVTRLITQAEKEGLTATGVEFTFGESRNVHVAHARKEVVLCAGALKSPQILELSGIGRPDILSSIGVPVKLALDGVGENVQEHNYVPIPFILKDDTTEETFDVLADPEVAAKHFALYPQGKGLFNRGIVNLAFAPLEQVSPHAAQYHDTERALIKEGLASGKISSTLSEQYQLQIARFESKVPGCELVLIPGWATVNPANKPVPGKRYFSVTPLTNHPFSRGTIHCTSNDPHVDPAFDPHYFEHDIDLLTMVELVRFGIKIAKTAPFTDLLESTVSPILGTETPTDDQLKEFVKDNLITSYHTVGPLSMLPREKGGVVDSRLKVYGTANIRVADLSIVPLHISGHLQTTAYVIGEKAADIIKGVV